MTIKITWLGLTLLLCSLAFAQETVIYQFGANGPNDGAVPNGGLIFDAAGNIYGTTVEGGSFEFGTVFELSPLQDGTWQETILYNFCSVNGCLDGQFPHTGLISDVSGNLYGTTAHGGTHGNGTVFELSPPAQPAGSWTEQVLWSFGGPNDGSGPYGGLAIDAVGNLYGTTIGTVSAGDGMVFEVSPVQNGWSETILHVFCLNYPDCSDGAQPMAGVTFDKAGNLYGTTMFGGTSKKVAGWGVVYELSPTKSGWTETVLKAFTKGTGGRTTAGITIDPAGHLYGAVSQGPPNRQCGGVFRLNSFVGFLLTDGCTPQSNLLYSSGVLYGVTMEGGKNSQGIAFKLARNGSKVSETALYDFCQQANCADGRLPNGSLTSRNGQLYGATSRGGLNDGGVIFQIPE
jgi:uncharacterized repeat protein (TIGR03803 family)